MNEDEFQIIKDNYTEIKNAFGIHDEAMQKCLKRIISDVKNK